MAWNLRNSKSKKLKYINVGKNVGEIPFYPRICDKTKIFEKESLVGGH